MRDDGDCQPATGPERLALDETAGLTAGSCAQRILVCAKTGRDIQTAVTGDDAVRGMVRERAEGKRKGEM